MDLKPDPINILGMAKIVRSPTDMSQGPCFYVMGKKEPLFVEVSLFCLSGGCLDYWSQQKPWLSVA